MKIKAGFVTLLLALVFAGCSSFSSPEPLEVAIEMNEFAYTPKDLEFRVGQEVTLHLINAGALDHEIMFGREVITEDGAPGGYHVDMFEAAVVTPEVSMAAGSHEDDHTHEEDGHEGDEHADEGGEHSHAGFMVLVPAGLDEYTMTFTVTEEWEIGCFLDAGVHYTAGMVGTLTVLP